ncbi:HAD-superfamily hydrolase, subfamily IIB [Halobacteroides halobius DSM 5150]|uniref:HAD-superfamily hydrolase, subfamily IIB n=1 Tax=Halobacteroides halobius (strain ATCC 35273 / DSM 5150 / MD-1) TaxID=748449 RepID=L0KBI3_HALHC|nr:Cof-type HAD-IIB family hydrolase [Halobacteroides halobius]AGB41734.1 HAD-superfamily hydrolase, subfamily IIB [Halobacteroides halobius DSM 5150]
MDKVVAIDLDGTLLNDKGEITEYTKEVLLRLKEKGIKIILASGRPYQSMLNFAQELNLDMPLISNNGALVKRPDGKILAQEFISDKLALEVLAYANQEGLHLSFYFPESICVEKITKKVDVHIKEEGVVPKAVGDLRETLEQNLINILFNIKQVEMDKVVTDLKEEFASSLSIAQTADNYIDIMACGVSKGSALEKLLPKYQLDTAKLISFGNNYNDLSMLELADCGVAMANAPKAIKDKADKVAKDNDQDGVAIMLEKIFL